MKEPDKTGHMTSHGVSGINVSHQIGNSQPLSNFDDPPWCVPVVRPEVVPAVVVVPGGEGAGATGQAYTLLNSIVNWLSPVAASVSVLGKAHRGNNVQIGLDGILPGDTSCKGLE